MMDMHPAAEWAREQPFTPEAVDCTTTVVLKILDGKCKMLPGEKRAVQAVYRVVREQPGVLFDAACHHTIDQADENGDAAVMEEIHRLRLYAEAQIPKPVMKKYKAMLREGLFG